MIIIIIIIIIIIGERPEFFSSYLFTYMVLNIIMIACEVIILLL